MLMLMLMDARNEKQIETPHVDFEGIEHYFMTSLSDLDPFPFGQGWSARVRRYDGMNVGPSYDSLSTCGRATELTLPA